MQWAKTKWPGGHYREHDTWKHTGKPVQCFAAPLLFYSTEPKINTQFRSIQKENHYKWKFISIAVAYNVLLMINLIQELRWKI